MTSEVGARHIERMKMQLDLFEQGEVSLGQLVAQLESLLGLLLDEADPEWVGGLQSARNFVRVGPWEQYAYDAYGNLTSVTDPTGGVSRYHNDANGRITQIVDADGVVEVNNTYDSSDRVISQTMSSGWAQPSPRPTTRRAISHRSRIVVNKAPNRASIPTAT